MARIRFSIVITSHNQSNFIRAAVESAIAQNHPRKEIIVVDDGSSDGSVEILEQYADSIQLVKFAKNRGAIEARNRGAAQATGEYLVFLDGDDILMPWALDVYERTAAMRNPKTIFGGTSWFQGAIPRAREEDVPREIEMIEYGSYLIKDRPIGLSASSIVVNRQAFQDVGGWSQGIFHLDCQDLCAKLGTFGPMVLICSPPVTFYRIHSGNSIHNVAPFLRMARRLMEKERSGAYPGGAERRFERYASLGGLLVFWVKRAMRAGLYQEAWKLAASGWTMMFAAVARRSITMMRKRRPIEVLELRASKRLPRVEAGAR